MFALSVGAGLAALLVGGPVTAVLAVASVPMLIAAFAV